MKRERETFSDLFKTQLKKLSYAVYCTSSEKNEKKNNGDLQMHLVTEQE